MVVGEASINNIMSGIESTGGVRLHNHRKKLKQRFDIIKKLGQGTYGKVQLGINKETGQEVAIKTIKKCKIETEADLIRIRREIQIMSSVQHPNIIHIYEVFENREKMVLVMEYAAGGELYDYLSERKVLAEEEARRIFRQIATAVYYCHKHKICHRDLKLENILLDENGNAKIADFGLSNVFDETRLLSTFCGSPLYASPEIVKGTPYHGPEVDCWSLGVLLYTLVYGAMPFDGSNFKRLVKQISQGDYFEPKTPSPASPLIKEMLTVSPSRRADMEKICSHWWVNESYSVSCLELAEELANITPVRLDLLLSLAPPPPEIGSDKLVIANADNTPDGANMPDVMVPTRSLSVGSIMDHSTPQQKIREIIADQTPTAATNENSTSPKRKIEPTVSTENATGAKRKERSRKKDRDHSADRRTSHRSSSRCKQEKVETSKSMDTDQVSPAVELQKNLTQTMDVAALIPNELQESSTFTKKQDLDAEDNAACSELINKETIKRKKSVKTKKPKAESATQNKIIEEPDKEKLVDKENEIEKPKIDEKQGAEGESAAKVVKKKVFGDNNVVEDKKDSKIGDEVPKKENKTENKENKTEISDDTSEKSEDLPAQPPTKPIERRRSKIFETAEKFNNMAAAASTDKSSTEKPKKIFIPGVNVDGFKQAFERKASLTNSSPIKNSLSKKSSSPPQEDKEKPKEVNEESSKEDTVSSPTTTEQTARPQTPETPEELERRDKMKRAVSVISNAIDREGARKSKSRPTMNRKPPVPFGASGRSASGGITQLTSPLSPTGGDGRRILKLQVGPEIRTASVHVGTPEDTKYFTGAFGDQKEKNDDTTKTSSLEVNLKSATLPRRKTSKAEITLNYPHPKPATMEFKTEMQHRIENQPRLKTQRSEVAFPVSPVPHLSGFRSTSLEPETKEKARERIIPISLVEETQLPSGVRSPPMKPPAPRTQRTISQGQRSNSVSRQSTQDSDTDSTSTQPELIRKSPREFIIPIAIEGGGYVTPRSGSLEPSESGTPTSKFSGVSSRFGRTRRMNSLLSDREGSEDESPFTALHRHSSIGRDSDNEDSRKDRIHFHRLRSSRPTKSIDHADSLSSGEEDDDDGFELLTAENLFSTLLSRVRSLTQRLNVEDGGRPGFPSSRLLSHFGRDNFWDNLRREPFRNSFGRTFSRESSQMSDSNKSSSTPWRRTSNSSSRFSAAPSEAGSTTSSQTLPRDSHDQNSQNLDLSDLDLFNLNLSEKDAVALSYLTPGLSRRIKKQLLSQLPLSQARKLSRTLSMQQANTREFCRTNQSSDESNQKASKYRRASEGQLPPKFEPPGSQTEKKNKTEHENPDASRENSVVKLENSTQAPKIVENLIEENPPKSVEEGKTGDGTDKVVKQNYLNRRSVSFDPSSSFRTVRDQVSPFSESSKSEFTDLSSRSEMTDYSSILSGIHNADLTESDRKLLENYRKQREHRRAMRSNSLLDSTRNSFYKPPLPESSTSIATDTDRPILSKYFTNSSFLDPVRSRTPSVNYNTSDYMKSRTLDRRNMTTPRRVSRFLRPDFYDNPPGESIVAKEKHDRELETQKVLKEIRDKRLKRKLGIRQQSESISPPVTSINTEIKTQPVKIDPLVPQLDPIVDKIDIAATKSKIAKLIRPKSFPEKKESPPSDSINSSESKESSNASKIEKDLKSDSKIAKSTSKSLSKAQKSKKGDSPQKSISSASSDEKSGSETATKSNRNKFFQSLEKKFEKLRSFSSNSSDANSNAEDSEKISRVSSAIRRLREQSLPRTTEHITESGLIKRAVSVEDLSNINNNANNRSNTKISRRSVSKILNLFKKYEDKDSTKSKKSEKNSEKIADTSEKPSKTTKESTPNEVKIKSKIPSSKTAKKEDSLPQKAKLKKGKPSAKSGEKVDANSELEKPAKTSNESTSSNLFKKLDENPVKTEENKNDSKTSKLSSKLPIFRRSIDLGESSKLSNEVEKKDLRKSLNIQLTNCDKKETKDKNTNKSENVEENKSLNNNQQLGKDNIKRKSLQLDFSKLPRLNIPPEINNTLYKNTNCVNHNLLSPRDDSSCDNWSTTSADLNERSLSDAIDTSHHRDLLNSALSPLSGDESESVIDRIRRKSFYSRFNEKKKSRKSSLVGPGADYNNLAYKTPRHHSKDDKIHLDPLPLLSFRSSSSDHTRPVSEASPSQTDSSYVPRKQLISNNNNLKSTNRLYSDRDQHTGVEDTFAQAGNGNSRNSHDVSSAPSSTSSLDANCNLLENNNVEPGQ